jgi:hypothetical protein
LPAKPRPLAVLIVALVVVGVVGGFLARVRLHPRDSSAPGRLS